VQSPVSFLSFGKGVPCLRVQLASALHVNQSGCIPQHDYVHHIVDLQGEGMYEQNRVWLS